MHATTKGLHSFGTMKRNYEVHEFAPNLVVAPQCISWLVYLMFHGQTNWKIQPSSCTSPVHHIMLCNQYRVYFSIRLLTETKSDLGSTSKWFIPCILRSCKGNLSVEATIMLQSLIWIMLPRKRPGTLWSPNCIWDISLMPNEYTFTIAVTELLLFRNINPHVKRLGFLEEIGDLKSWVKRSGHSRELLNIFSISATHSFEQGWVGWCEEVVWRRALENGYESMYCSRHGGCERGRWKCHIWKMRNGHMKSYQASMVLMLVGRQIWDIKKGFGRSFGTAMHTLE